MSGYKKSHYAHLAPENFPVFEDTLGRRVTPVPQYTVDNYADAWKEYCLAIKPHRNARRFLRDLVKLGLDTPSECINGIGNVCSIAYEGCTTNKPWVQEKDNPYTPFLWRSYLLGNYEYDLVVYRRPRRSVLYKLLCCGL